ncbi:hypothetical protein HCH_03920 [Hahella chejuensis KCTC 2396]|uniref:Transmembrane protein (PGPGW) n=2 Tax=Hahella chejuensis TaxID=158327 RepID=Q2SFD3_HAHCH|nr:hypothetical protein HCH_03920 [Hahella chejuensis KCTC 2396]
MPRFPPDCASSMKVVHWTYIILASALLIVGAVLLPLPIPLGLPLIFIALTVLARYSPKFRARLRKLSRKHAFLRRFVRRGRLDHKP